MSAIFASFDPARGVVALVIAIALFGVVRTETKPAETGTFEISVDLRNVPPGLFPEPGPRSPAVRARVSAPRDVISSLQPSDFHASVDLRAGRVGADDYPVTVDVPDPQTRVVEILPARVPVRLEGTAQKTVPVRVNRTGNVPPGYDAGPTGLDPQEVQVVGPASIVALVASMGVDLTMEGVTVNVDATSAPTPLDAQGRAISNVQQLKLTPQSVHVQVAVTQQLSYKTVAIQASVGGTPQSGFAIQGITVEPPVATLAGAPRALSAVDFASTEHIDVGDANGTLARQVSILVPPGIFVVQQDLVRITVRIAPLEIAQPVTSTVTADGLSEDVRLAGKIPSVQILLDGPTPAFRLLNFGDVKARVDLSGLGPGNHLVPVQANAPSDFRVVSVTPESVTVTLEALPRAASEELRVQS